MLRTRLSSLGYLVAVSLLIAGLFIDSVVIKSIFSLTAIFCTSLRGNRFLTLTQILFYLYTIVPYVFYLLGAVYFDISENAIYNGTIYSLNLLLCVNIAIALVSKLISTSLSELYFRNSRREMSNVNTRKYYFICSFSVLVCIISLFQVFNFGSFENLRYNKDILIFAENQYFQLILLPFALVFLCKHGETKKINHLVFFVLIISPLLLSGSRKELFLILCSYYLLNREIFLGSKKIYFISFIAFMLLLPLVREGAGVYDAFTSFHEFIFPQYSFYFLLENPSYFEMFENSDLLRGLWSIVPGFLRLSDYYTIGNSFSSFGFVNIGLASNPSLEAMINFSEAGWFIYPLLILLYLCFCGFLIRNKIYFCSPFIFYILLIGRSDFWLMIFFSLYSSFIMFFLLKRFKV